MRPPFKLEGNDLYFRDKLVGFRGQVTLEGGDPLASVERTWHTTGLAPEPGGDALWIGRDQVFGWERKTHSDFWSSRNSGHLADQLARMVKWYDSVILGIEGGPFTREGDLEMQGVAEYTLQKVLLDYQDLGVRIVYIYGGPNETLRMMDKLRREYSMREAREPLRQPNSARGAHPMLLAIPGIGPAIASRLVGYYGSVDAVLQAPHGDLELHFGASITGKIWRALERE